jgi:hypothetical protein
MVFAFDLVQANCVMRLVMVALAVVILVEGSGLN